MPKKALIIIELAPESTNTSNNKILKEILKDSQIPWCTRINKIEVYGR
jgi:hypothetical protein